ncbi:MAG: hypothetical protein PHW73_09430 [Atribacterota bacterium]|jgi:hypothetical protein|nr:hypothetical protein [Atribacterota bacterium]
MGLQAVSASKQASGEVVQSIENAENMLTQVRDFRQINEADAFVFEKFNAIKSIASEDIDFDATKYEAEIEKVGVEAAKTISGGLAREKFMANFRKQAIAVNWGIRNSFREREIEASKAAIEYNRQQLVNSYASMTPAEQITAVSNFKRNLVGGVEAGIFNQATAQQIDLKLQEDVQKSVVDNHIIADPDAALIGLKEGKDGPYPGISEQFRTDSIEKAIAYSKKYEAEAEKQRKEKIKTNENDIITRMIDPNKPKPTEGEIINLMNTPDTITPKFAKAVIENIRSAKKVKESNKVNATFNKLAGDIINPNKKEDEIRTELLIKNATGEIDDSDFQTLYTFFVGVKKEDVEKAMPQKTWFQRLFNNGKDKGLRQEIMTKMFKQYMQKVNSGSDPGKAVTEVLNTSLDEHLAEQAKQPNKQYATNQETKQRAYSEDGGVTWYDEKTGDLIK